MAYLWLGERENEGAPWEYTSLVLCRDIYHCSYTELLKQPLGMALKHIKAAEVEAEAAKRNAKR